MHIGEKGNYCRWAVVVCFTSPFPLLHFYPMTKHKLRSLAGIAVLSFCLGCSSNVNLTGKVVYSDNGEPVTAGEVQFTTSDYFARATIEPDGSFKASSAKEGDGIPPGTYNIAILRAEKETGTDRMGSPTMTPLIDPKYSKTDTSGLTVTVDGSTKPLELKVDRYKP